MNPADAMRQAAKFERTIPSHLKSDALLQSVVQQLAQGGTFTERSWRYIEQYRQTAAYPMTAKQFNEAMMKVVK